MNFLLNASTEDLQPNETGDTISPGACVQDPGTVSIVQSEIVY